MITVIQRVQSASVSVDGEVISSIGRGLLVLAGVEKGDREEEIDAAAKKIVELRIFGDEQGKMNLDVQQVGGEVLAVSQFTLAGSIAKGRRPSFDKAEEPGRAEVMFGRFVEAMRAAGVVVKTGKFRAMMVVALENDGPVTFVMRKC